MASLIPKLALNPLLTAPLLLLLTRAPPSLRAPLLHKLAQYISPTTHISPTTLAKALTTLRWLTAIGLARWLHTHANQLAQNNFRLTSEQHRYSWPHEIALVTGAAGGFGSLFCKDLAAKGVTVIAVDITAALPAAIAAHPLIHYYNCDITSRAAVEALGHRVRAAHGNPSILINNAGIAFAHSILTATQPQLERLFAVNVLSHYYTTQAFLPAMLAARKGHVVTIASLASFVSPPGMVPYASTKAAALSFHDGLAAEARAMHAVPEVKFTVVHPTFAATPLIAAFRAELAAGGVKVIEPQRVSDAVVGQVWRCRGAQLMVPGEGVVVGCLRGMPSWLSQALLRVGELRGVGAGERGGRV
ncbi:hypothetical protein LTR08_007602 [Meristemomyces frigidus]|nr:hypothetical protein LTR08_007602 [Meristemomyces frigidus]